MSRLAHLEPVSLSERNGFDSWRLGLMFVFSLQRDGADAIVFLGKRGTFGEEGGLVRVSASAPTLPPLQAVTTDKALYREGDDTVRLLVWSPQASGGAAELELKLNGSTLSKVQVDINDQGLGLFTMRDPLSGEYTAELGPSKASFTVAGYKLAPLTVVLNSSRFENGPDNSENLHIEISAESYGAALKGRAKVSLVDLGPSPPVIASTQTMTFSSGRISGSFALTSKGPFAIQLQSTTDAAKTATVPLPGTSSAERSEVVLSSWGRQTFARGVSFDGSTALRGLFLGSREHISSTPLRLLAVTDGVVRLQALAELQSWRVAVMDPHSGTFQQHAGGNVMAGEHLEIPVVGDWCWLAAGVISLGRTWEGSAALLLPEEHTLSLEVPSRAEPGAFVTLMLSGAPHASVYVLVKDARLQTVDTPTSAAGVSRRRQIEAAQKLGSDTDVHQSLDMLFHPEPPFRVEFSAMPAPPRAVGGGFPGGAQPVMPRSMGAGAPVMSRISPPSLGGLGTKPASRVALPVAAPPEGPAREDFPEVVFAQLVSLDADGQAAVAVKLGDAMGTIVVEAFSSRQHHHSSAQAEVLVSREVFGELVLPRFVADGDYAEGRLYVCLREGRAHVEILRDGEVVRSEDVMAPGETVTFPAVAGDWEAVVRGALVDRSRGRVDEPGRLVWLQRATRILSAGEALAHDDVDGALALRVLPSLDESLKGMIGGLRSYAHCCCEQTSSVLLAASAAWLTAGSESVRQDAVSHIRACVDRMVSMHLPGKGFKGWPSFPDEVFVYSPGATLNLLQLDMFDGIEMPSLLREVLDRAGEMARDAAAAHNIDPAPAEPKCAREAYGRFVKFVSDRQRMADFIRERIEPWDKEMLAILKFELPAMMTETFRRTPSMIRCETAFGAAALMSSDSPELITQGLSLANTVLGAVKENGSLYSTLDSVAAITMMTAMSRANLAEGGTCRINGEELSNRQAAALGAIDAVEVLKGTAQVEIQRLVSEDYTALQSGVQASVRLEKRRRHVKQVALGDDLELVVSLKSGYEAGDLVHVFLPDALSWVHGGGQVKKFSIDLQGRDTLRVLLAATSRTIDANGELAPQHFAVCVRNMYDEERGAGFGDLSILVSTEPESSGILGRVLSGLRALLG